MSVVLTAQELYRFYRTDEDEVRALRGVSLEVRSGEIVAVAGPSGSGKSTLLACLAGLDEPSAGRVEIDGQRLTGRTEAQRAAMRAANLGVMTQSSSLLPHLTVAANVRVVQRLARAPRDEQLLARVGLTGRVRALPSQLSGGEVARAGLAAALAADPRVLLADEPTGELDAASERQVLDLIRGVADGGVAVLVVTHSATVINAADRVIRLEDGVVA